MRRIKLGDIIEIPTPKGLAYGQYINKHKSYGSLVRIFKGFHEKRPNRLADVMGEVQFLCFFPLQYSVKDGVVTIVGKAPIPPEAAEFPIFRNGVEDTKTGKVAVWWFWDGENEWRVGTLMPEQRKMPMLGCWNDTLVIERIVEGWTAENDPR